MEAVTLIRKLAHQLQQTGTIDVSIKLPTDILHDLEEYAGNISLENDNLNYSSLEQRNMYAAEHVFELVKLRLQAEPRVLFDEAYELWKKEINHHDKASGRFIALGSCLLDPLALATKRIRDNENIFQVLHLLEGAFPHFETLNVDSLVELCAVEHEATKNDLAGGRIHLSIRKFLVRHQEFSVVLYQRLVNEVQESTVNLLGDAVMAVSELDFAKAVDYACADIKSTIPARAIAGAGVLGRLLLQANPTTQDFVRIESAIMHLLENADGDLLSQAILTAARSMYKTHAFDNALKSRGLEGNIQTLFGVAQYFSSHIHEMFSRDDFNDWLAILVGTKPEYQGILDNLDVAFAELLADPINAQKVTDFLGEWAQMHGKHSGFDTAVTTAFDSCIFTLAKNHMALSCLITDWLLSDKHPLHANLAGILGKLAENRLTNVFFNKYQLEKLDHLDLLLLARRTLGFIHNREQQMSLVLSLLWIETSVERIFPLLRGLLIYELGYDYPGSTISACKEAATTAQPVVRGFLNSVINEIEQRLEVYRNLPPLEDIKPSTRLQRQIATARAKEIANIFEITSKNSLFRQIATQIPIKAGRGSFQFRDDKYAEPIQFTSLSQEIEIPRREISDPIGNAIRILNFRLAKRGDE